jgi:hypothetical protein
VSIAMGWVSPVQSIFRLCVRYGQKSGRRGGHVAEKDMRAQYVGLGGVFNGFLAIRGGRLVGRPRGRVQRSA